MKGVGRWWVGEGEAGGGRGVDGKVLFIYNNISMVTGRGVWGGPVNVKASVVWLTQLLCHLGPRLVVQGLRQRHAQVLW